MTQLLRRREFLEAGLAGALTLAVPMRSTAQAAALSTTRLAGSLSLVSGAGANVTVLAGADGALLVDGGLPQRTRDVLAAIEGISGTPRVPLLFNTNWRPEHNGLNETVAADGATIIAHENTKLWMRAHFVVEWEHRDHAPRPDEALPNQTFYTQGEIDFAGEKVAYGYLPQAHTDGDIYVLFPDSNVLVVSDLLAVGGYPVCDYVTGGWIGGLEQATKALLELADTETRVVAAAGTVHGRAQLEAQLELVTVVREAVRDAYRSGHSVDEFIAARPTQAFDAERGDPELFLRLVYKGAWGHVRELGGGII